MAEATIRVARIARVPVITAVAATSTDIQIPPKTGLSV